MGSVGPFLVGSRTAVAAGVAAGHCQEVDSAAAVHVQQAVRIGALAVRRLVEGGSAVAGAREARRVGEGRTGPLAEAHSTAAGLVVAVVGLHGLRRVSCGVCCGRVVRAYHILPSRAALLAVSDGRQPTGSRDSRG